MGIGFKVAQMVLIIVGCLIINGCNSVEEKKRPPIHIRAMFKSDPATSLMIGWNRHKKSKKEDDRVYFDTQDHGLKSQEYAYSAAPDHYSRYKNHYNAFVHLKELRPATRYYFLVQNSFGTSKRYYVDTLPDGRDARISFIAGGDSRNNRGPRQLANLLVRKLKPHFVLFGGDMTDKGSGNQWWRWFDDWQLTHGDDGRVTPVITARGNHEDANSVLHELFWLSKDNYYALTIAGGLLRTYVLNTEHSIAGEQTNWLINDLKKNSHVLWRVASYHRSMRPHVSSKNEGTATYKFWAGVFYDYGMDVVFESDSHAVKSTWPIRPSLERGHDEGFVRDDEMGTVYVGEGTWGAPLRSADDNKNWTRDSGKFNQFKWVFVDEGKIEMRTIKVDNAMEVTPVDLLERFTLPTELEVWNPANGPVVTIE